MFYKNHFDSVLSDWINYTKSVNRLPGFEATLQNQDAPRQSIDSKQNIDTNKYSSVLPTFVMAYDEKDEVIPYNCLTKSCEGDKIVYIYENAREVSYTINIRRNGCHQLAIALQSSLQNTYLIYEIFNKNGLYKPETSRINVLYERLKETSEEYCSFGLTFRYTLIEKQYFDYADKFCLMPIETKYDIKNC